jgi:hypothetical protein
MKTLASIALGIALLASVALGQTPFPQPGENIWIDASKILYGVMPIQTLGTNALVASPGSSLQYDGYSLFWGASGASSTNPAPVAYVSNLYATTISNVNVAYITNAYITNLNVSYISNITDIQVTTNVTFQQNISVSGKATLNYITVTNQLYFTTNAFPLAAGSTWNFTKPYQFITTNNDFAITAISGVSNNLINWAVLEVSNSAAATHFCDLSSLPWHIIGTSSTNKVYVGSGKVAIISANLRGLSSSNLVTAVEQ